jgi:hypothetical protein
MISARIALLALLGPVCAAACAQPSPSRFAFATAAEARQVLGAHDDYVAATAPLERSVKTRRAAAVDEAGYRRYMEGTAQEWSEAQRRHLAPALARLERFAAPIKAGLPKRVLLVLASSALLDGAPHTRGEAIILPAGMIDWPPETVDYILSHELFHVLSRADAGTREKLYAAIGFRPCARVDIPPGVASLRLTNPDVPVSRHAIAVRYRGMPVDALPYVRLRSAQVDPRQGMISGIEVAWLLVERDGGACRARTGADEMGVPPERLEGLLEQVGRNTAYLFHAEEILADNFALLFLAGRGAPKAASPEVLERVRRILFE